MTELKTLKDFEEIGNIDCQRRFNLLRQEAIKQVEEISKDRSIVVQLFTDGKKRKGNPIGKAIYGDEERKLINKEKIELIKHFFNLTEEDLQEKN